MAQGCQKCGAAAPPQDELEAAGWGDGGRICPNCRAVRTARARASSAQIAQGLARELSRGWAGGATFVSLYHLPSRQLVSTWALGAADALRVNDRDELWREAGDGWYLMSAERDGLPTEYRAVTVEGGRARAAEPIDELEIPALVALARALDQPGAGPAEVIIAVDPEVRVNLRDVTPAPRLLS